MKLQKFIFTTFLILFLSSGYAQTMRLSGSFLTDRMDSKTNGNYVTDSTYFYLGNIFGESWFNNKIYRVSQRNNAGNVLQAFDYEYDTLDFYWYPQRKYEGSFLNDTIRKLWLSWAKNKSTGSWMLADSIHFNINGSPNISWYKLWDQETGKFTEGKLSEFIYNEQGILHLTYNHIWDTIDGDWDRDNYEVVYYNQNDLDSLRQFYYWNGINWIQERRILFSYNPKLEPREEIHQFWEGNAWINLRKWEFIHKEGRIDEVYEYDWQEVLEEWIYAEFSDYSYYPDALLEGITDYFWNGSEWLNATQKNYTYNEDQLTEEILTKVWSFSSETWNNVSLNSYIHDENGNREEFSFYTWNPDQEKWMNFYREKNFWNFFTSPSVPEIGKLKFKIIPNPARDYIRIAPKPEIENAREKLLLVYSMDGRLLKTESLREFSRMIYIGSLPTGMYKVVLKTETGTFGTMLVISE